MASKPPSVAVVGGGLSGLAAALRLQEAGADWRLFEASPRLGGVIETVEEAGYRIELSADNFLTREPWATDLCRKVGLERELLPTNRDRRRALVVRRGRVVPVPEGFVLMAPRALGPILASPVLSLLGKARLAAERWVPPKRAVGDESVASFARRRLGREAFERLVQPLVAGIYTADPERLSMAATLPRFLEQEAEHGSLWRAAQRGPGGDASNTESGARYGLFVAPRLGMQQLVDAVAARLPSDRLSMGSPVAGAIRQENGWRLAGADDQPLGEHDALIVATPAYAAARLLRDAEPSLAERLDAIEYAGASIVCLGVRTEQVARPIDGFGFVVPAAERRRIIAASFSSYKFPGRAPDERLLIRVFVGGALQPELVDLDDDALVRLAREELGDLVGLRGEPEIARVARWPRQTPQYHVGHLDRVAEIERLTPASVELAGAAYRGVGVPQCVRSGELAAERALARSDGR